MEIPKNLKILSHLRIIEIPKQWVQIVIIITTLFASTIAAYWGETQHQILLLTLVGGIAIFLTLLKQPNFGFILIFIAGMFIPFTGPGGINSAVLIVALLIGIWFLDMLVVKRNFNLERSRTLTPVFVFLLISIIAFGMGQIPWFSYASQAPLEAQVGGFGIFVLSIGTLLISAHLIRDILWLKIIVWVFIGLGAVYVFGRLIRSPISDQVFQRGFTANSMFWTWLVALSLCQVIFNKKLKPPIKLLLVVIVITTLYVAYVQANSWKSGWVPPLIAVFVLFGMRYKRFAILALPFVILLAVYMAFQLISTDQYSWGTRVDAWIIVLEISRISPIFGLGFSNYYWYTPFFPIRGWEVSFNSHSQYVDLIAQVGILGLFCFLWIFFEIGRLSWNLTKKIPEGFANAYSYGVLAGLMGTLMASFLVDWVLPFVYNIGFNGFRASVLPWIFFGGLISVEQIYKDKIEN